MSAEAHIAARARGSPPAARTLAAYGLLGAPLAMGALPLYVHLPQFYGEHLGVPLAALGVVLLALRLADAALDPLLGALSDRASRRKRLLAWSVPVFALGILALFRPPELSPAGLLLWLGFALGLAYLGFSVATINHHAWGAELTDDAHGRTRVTAVREALALGGVVVAAVLPSALGGDGEGLPRFALLFVPFALACLAVTLLGTPGGDRAIRPEASTRGASAPAAPTPATSTSAAPAPATPPPLRAAVLAPMRNPAFRALLAVFVLNGTASAIPATLVLFFVAHVLQAPAHAGLFLATYFLAGAAGMPLWLRLSRAHGKAPAWLAAMVLAVAAFAWAALLDAGEVAAFAAICALSGLALGADLALPPSMLADVIGPGRPAREAGAYFGVWTLTTKLNLALAAGIALPLVAALGFDPSSDSPEGTRALAIVYALVPCALKLGAAAVLWRARVAPDRNRRP